MFGKRKEEPMVEAAPQPPPPDAAVPQAPYLMPVEMLGAIQRLLTDCFQYCGQHPSQVDPRVVFAHLDRAAQWVNQIPFDPAMGQQQPPPVPNGKKAN